MKPKNIIDFYCNDISYYVKITKEIPRLIRNLFIPVMIILLLVCFFFLSKPFYICRILIAIIALMIMYAIIQFYSYKLEESKRNFEKKYNQKYEDWNVNELRDYLSRFGYYNEKALRELKIRIESILKLKRSKYISFATISAVILVSPWNNFINYIFSIYQYGISYYIKDGRMMDEKNNAIVITPNDTFNRILLILGITLIFGLIIVFVLRQLSEFIDSLSIRYLNIQKLSAIVDDLIFEDFCRS